MSETVPDTTSTDFLPASVRMHQFLRALVALRHLGRAEASELMSLLLSAEVTDAQIAAVLTALAIKGETSDELIGFASALVQRMVRFEPSLPVLDTAGTGASKAKTFNVSTAAAFVIAGAGLPIAKHGGRAASSTSGSADVLKALGVRIDCTPATARRALDEIGICFLFAPLYHPALARVAPVRRELGFRTVFNLVGPLVNPCLASFRILGVSEISRMLAMAEALLSLNVERAWVVRGNDGLDELTLACETQVIEIEEGRLRTIEVTPRDFGLEPGNCSQFRGAGPQANAVTITAVLDGSRRDAARDLVLLNAAAAIHVRMGVDLHESRERAAEALDSGRALAKLHGLRSINASVEGVSA